MKSYNYKEPDIDLFLNIFKSRQDIYAEKWQSKNGKKGFSPACKNKFKKSICILLKGKKCKDCANADYYPLTLNTLQSHLSGKVIGVYPLLPDNTSWFAAVDFDGKTGDPLKDAKDLLAVCEVQGLPAYIERSQSGNGYHLWIFFDSSIQALKIRIVIFALLKEAQVINADISLNSFDRIFPNQDRLSGKGLGNLIALPLQGAQKVKEGKSVFLNTSNGLEPYPDQFEFLKTIKRATEKQFDDLISEWNLKPEEKNDTKPNVPAKTIDEIGTQLGIEALAQCDFIQYCKEKPKEVTEPQWFHLPSILAPFKGGREYFHELSKGDKNRYSETETNSKFDNAIDALKQGLRPHRCDTIRKDGFGCKKDCGVKSPAALVFKEDNPQIKINDDSQAFPYWVMSGVADEFSDLYSKVLEPPQEFFYFSFLTCLGNLLADKLKLKSEIEPQPRLYTVLIGESADDRKSTAANKTISFFRETLTEDFNVCYGVGSAEGLQKRLKDAEPSKLLLFLDEFKQFVSKCKIDSSVLLPCVNTLFESNRYESQTKTTSINLEESYLSILACTTKATFDSMWSSTFTDIGFNNRLWLVPGSGKRKFAIPKQIPISSKNKIKKLLGETCGLIGEMLQMDIVDDAESLHQKWYENIKSSVHAKRIDTYAMRLMPLLAINDKKTTVDKKTVEKVIALANWQLKVRNELDPVDADNTVAKIEEKIRRQLRKKSMKTSELKQYTNARKAGLWFFDAALKNLIKAGEISFDSKTKYYGLIT